VPSSGGQASSRRARPWRPSSEGEAPGLGPAPPPRACLPRLAASRPGPSTGPRRRPSAAAQPGEAGTRRAWPRDGSGSQSNAWAPSA